MRLQSIASNIAQLKTEYDRGMGALAVLEPRLEAAMTRRKELDTSLVQWELERILLSKVSELARQRIKGHIEATVTAALQAIIGEPGLRFEVRLRDLGGQPAADWLVVSGHGDDEVVADPEDGRGGGIVDIVSMALRMAVLELGHPRNDGPLLVDEPGKHVSAEYIENLAGFLRDYAAKSGRQVIMITHNPVVGDVAHKTYRFSHVDGETEVSVV